MPPRARRRAIQPGLRTASAVGLDDVGECEISRYITPPMARTARVQSVSASGTASSSRRGVPKAFPGACASVPRRHKTNQDDKTLLGLVRTAYSCPEAQESVGREGNRHDRSAARAKTVV